MAGRLELFDDRAKRVLAFAQDESVRLHHGYIGPEHLLLGILRGHGTVAAGLLNSSGVELVKARKALEAMSGRGDPHQEFTEIVLSSGAKKIIDLAPEEAGRMRAERVAPEHVLLGILREPGKAEPILQAFGVTPEEIRRKILGGSAG